MGRRYIVDDQQLLAVIFIIRLRLDLEADVNAGLEEPKAALSLLIQPLGQAGGSQVSTSSGLQLVDLLL